MDSRTIHFNEGLFLWFFDNASREEIEAHNNKKLNITNSEKGYNSYFICACNIFLFSVHFEKGIHRIFFRFVYICYFIFL